MAQAGVRVYTAGVTPTRVEFLHLPAWQQTAFYLLALLSVGYAGFRFAQRARWWWQGRPIDWKPDWVGNMTRFALLQRKVGTSRPRSGGPMHLLIFYGFMALVLATTLLAVNSYSPVKFHQGTYYLVYEFTFDALGLLLMVGLGWAILRRALAPPRVMMTAPQDYWTLGILLFLAVGGYVLEAGRIANQPQPWDTWSFVGYFLAQRMGPVSDAVYRGLWWTHAIAFFAFVVTLPHLRLRHLVTGTLSVSASPATPMGALAPVSLEAVEATGEVGVSRIDQYSRWHLLSLDACMECGRCTEVCPATQAGKILNPRSVVLDLRGALGQTGDAAAVVPRVTEEALWACTTCQACVEACPVQIRHVDLIVDARRALVAEGHLSGSAATMLRQTGSTAHAWGARADQREDWMKGLEPAVPLARDRRTFDVLFWVGCAGATDPGAIKTTRAVAELLTRAGVDYACLGREESCTGDPARRVGDEFLYQDLAQRNANVFAQYTFRRVVTACPHCLNTFRHEMASVGARLPEGVEVLHHTELLNDLVQRRKLKAVPSAPGSTTYHDPCYLARANGVSDAPRALLGQESQLDRAGEGWIPTLEAGLETGPLVEPEHHGRKTRCCGAGGGRLWMEEAPDQRPGELRAQQLVDTGADTIALGCPFCRIMLDASVRQVTDRDVRLADVAELLRDANR